MEEDGGDLVTANSRESEPSTPSDAAFDIELEEQIQRLFAENLDDEARRSVSAGLLLEAIEAQIEDVLCSIGTDRSAATAVESAIIARFNAKQKDVPLVPRCVAPLAPSASSPDEPPSVVPFDNLSNGDRAVLCGLCYFSAPMALLVLTLFAYSRTSLQVCGFGCACSISQSIGYSTSFYLVIEAPRCVLFAWLSSRFVERETRVTQTQAPYRKISIWVLWLGALLLSLSAQTIISTFAIPRYLSVPVKAFVVAAPFFAYCVVKRAVACSAPIVLLQLIPLVFEVISPSYLGAPTEALFGWFVLVVVVERLLYYVLMAVMPETSDAITRTCTSHLATYFGQLAVLIIPFAIDTENNAYQLAVYACLVVLFEVALGTHLIDRSILACANKITTALHVHREFAFGALDLRLMSSYARQLSLSLAVFTVLICVGISQWPVALSTADCNGFPKVVRDWWLIWAVMACSAVCAFSILALLRICSGAVVRPLIIPTPAALAVGAYLAMLTPSAFEYLFVYFLFVHTAYIVDLGFGVISCALLSLSL